MKNLCLIIPCFNEEMNILGVINEVHAAVPEACVLVINDCSSDSTSEMARKSRFAKVIDLPCNLGVGGAVQTGFMFARRMNFSYAIKIDGDGQHDPAEVVSLMQKLDDEKADVVIGSRFLEETDGFKSSLMRRVGIRFFEILCWVLVGTKITDATSGFRAYNRKAIEFMADHYPSFDYPEPEEIILARKNGLRVVEVSVKMRPRKYGVSSISSAISIYYMLKVSLAMLFTFLRKPLPRKN